MIDGTLRGLIASVRQLKQAGTPFVLASVISTEPGARPRAGACSIITADGTTIGGMRAGGENSDFLAAVRNVLESRATRVVELRPPGVRVLLQRFAVDDGYVPLADLVNALGQSQSRVLASIIDSDDPELPAGMRFLVGGGAAIPAAGIADDIAGTAAAAAGSGAPLLVHQHTGAGEIEVFYLPFHPALHLLILGAVPANEPVTRLARLLGWRITIADPRNHLCDRARFPDVDAVLGVDPDDLESVLNLDRVDAALLATDEPGLDQQLLPPLARSSIPYVGIVGAPAHCASLMATLGPDAKMLRERVHGPAGVQIRADTPEEHALAIVTQIQSLHRPGRRIELPAVPPAVVTPLHGGPRPAVPVAAAQSSGAPVLWAVVLAAGGSSRFGGFKQMLEWEGESLLRRAVRVGTALCSDRVIVVHGPKPTKCQRELAGFNVRHVVNEHWESGMALSLKTALRALPEDCGGALVLLCDQPLLTADRVSRLASVWYQQPDRIVASAYGGTRGVPAIFPRRLFNDLRRLTGDRGARSLLEENVADVVDVDMPEAAVDIDTQGDYASLLTKGGKTT